MIDTHAHIDDEQYASDFAEYLERQREGGVEQILVPATNLASCHSVLSVCRQNSEFCRPALGLHPEDVKADWQQQLADIYPLVKENREQLCAIGEIGLDYYWDTSYKVEQQAAFRRQLDWALEFNLPVMIHNREATADILTILDEYTRRGLRGVFHCFTGSYETAMHLIKEGMYLGIGGVITFKNSRLKETLSGNGRPAIPLKRILLETDSPYMAPVPMRGKRNESIYIKYVMEALSDVYGVDKEQIDAQTTQNAVSLFGL